MKIHQKIAIVISNRWCYDFQAIWLGDIFSVFCVFFLLLFPFNFRVPCAFSDRKMNIFHINCAILCQKITSLRWLHADTYSIPSWRTHSDESLWRWFLGGFETKGSLNWTHVSWFSPALQELVFDPFRFSSFISHEFHSPAAYLHHGDDAYIFIICASSCICFVLFQRQSHACIECIYYLMMIGICTLYIYTIYMRCIQSNIQIHVTIYNVRWFSNRPLLKRIGIGASGIIQVHSPHNTFVSHSLNCSLFSTRFTILHAFYVTCLYNRRWLWLHGGT